MKYKVESEPLCRIKADAVVLPLWQSDDIAAQLSAADPSFAGEKKSLAEQIAAIAREDNFTGKQGQVLTLHSYGNFACKRIYMMGLGNGNEHEARACFRKVGANAARRICSNDKIATVCFCLANGGVSGGNGKEAAAPRELVRSLIEGWLLGSFSFQKYKAQKEDSKRATIEEIAIAGIPKEAGSLEQSFRLGETVAEATNFARGLIAEPASVMTPTRLAQEAERIAKEHKLTCRVIEAQEAEKLGMGSFLGVARGAAEPAKFVIIKYEAPGKAKTVAVVGKGITFDSGGLSLKPAQSMENMKYDMSGAAAVLGVMQVVGALKPDVSVLGILAATENMPGHNALHPGDVLTAMNGKTIEVNNTDAEGRLVLADALAFACKEGADELIDIATLTGAIVTALGRVAAGLMGTDQTLVDELIKAGAEAGEKLWQMPLYDEYKESLKSDIADLKNAGARGEAGSSAAGMFLREFVDGKPWAHLDIAGPGWLDKDKDECNKGGTAFGVRTICRYLLNCQSNGKK